MAATTHPGERSALAGALVSASVVAGHVGGGGHVSVAGGLAVFALASVVYRMGPGARSVTGAQRFGVVAGLQIGGHLVFGLTEHALAASSTELVHGAPLPSLGMVAGHAGATAVATWGLGVVERALWVTTAVATCRAVVAWLNGRAVAQAWTALPQPVVVGRPRTGTRPWFAVERAVLRHVVWRPPPAAAPA